MKKLLLFSVFALFLNLTVSAQEKKPAKIKYDSIETLDQIGATAEQKEKVIALYKETNEKIKVIKKDATLSDDEKKEKVAEISTARSKEYYTIITPEQRKILSEIRKKLAAENENK